MNSNSWPDRKRLPSRIEVGTPILFLAPCDTSLFYEQTLMEKT